MYSFVTLYNFNIYINLRAELNVNKIKMRTIFIKYTEVTTALQYISINKVFQDYKGFSWLCKL